MRADMRAQAFASGPKTCCACLRSPSFRLNSCRHLAATFAPKVQCASLKTRKATASSASSLTASESKTEQIFEQLEQRRASGQQAGGAGGGTTFEALKKADAAWEKLRNMKPGQGSAPQFVRRRGGPSPLPPGFDIVICGGTLGIFLGCSLKLKGFRVAVVERGPLKGRDQEWNISRKEIKELIEEGLLTETEAEECITSEFNPVRAGFHGGYEVWVRDVLNTGVRPDKAIAKVRARFEALGGKVFEFAAGESVDVYDDAAVLRVPSSSNGGSPSSDVSARLLIDCMGNFSPIVRQMRWGKKPDGVCLVVGTCSRGFSPEQNTTGDVIVTNTPIQPPTAPVPDVQYFWEAFPAGSGPADRTTYMFTYIDADPRRPTLLSCLEDYWRLMPEYQGVKLEDLEVLRILFGFFPTYRDSPLQPQFDRVMQVGDASGIQSPLSFGGFGALARHLPRLRNAIGEALEADKLDRAALASINQYNPGLSSAWMLQRAMSVRPGQPPNADFINRLLSSNFRTMERLGEPVLKPFLQDVVQFGPLGGTLIDQVRSNPAMLPEILSHVGPGPLLDWARHFIGLGVFTGLYRGLKPLDSVVSKQLNPELRYNWKRTLEALEYGSGSDYAS